MSFFGKNIKKIRGLKKMSQQGFAELFDLKRATLGAYEEGRSEPKLNTIIKIANHFSISIDDILTKEITINKLLSFNDQITTDINQVIKASFCEIPYVNELNGKLFIKAFLQKKDYDFLPKILLPITKKEKLLAFEVQDLIMASGDQGLYPGDIIICKEQEDHKLENSDIVLALIDNKFHIRRYLKTKKYIELIADHIHIDPLIIPLETTIYFWKVTQVIIRRYPLFP